MFLCQNRANQKIRNCELLIERMEKHFSNWSRRQLTLLGRIQIYKTFGISQFLYHLTIIEPDPGEWSKINAKINKFLWNKFYQANQAQAPARIKKEVIYTPVHKGGFGMIDLKEVITAVRLRRHFTLVSRNVHPLSQLLTKLMEGTSYLSTKPLIDIDEILTANMMTQFQKRLRDCKMPNWMLESDRILHANLLKAKTVDMVRPRKRQSTEMNYLIRMSAFTLAEIVRNQGRPLTVLQRIAQKDLLPAIMIIARLYKDTPALPEEHQDRIRNEHDRWVEASSLTSRHIREILFKRDYANPKIVLLDDYDKVSFFHNLSKITNVCNKSRMLRLLYGDVCCAERLVRFGLSDTDRCKRCFDKETILHLLVDCPYTRQIYDLMEINGNDIQEVLGVGLNKFKLEIRCDLLNYLVFKQHTMPPEVLVRTILEKFKNGLVNKEGVKKVAEVKLRQIFGQAL